MENLEKTRNQTDGLILYILSKGLRHIDELKQIIDEKFSTVKIGTLYSIITRLKTQKYITETRASSVDGSRRKYFSLTDLGRKVYEEKYSTAFSNVEVLDSSFVPESFIKQQKKERISVPFSFYSQYPRFSLGFEKIVISLPSKSS